MSQKERTKRVERKHNKIRELYEKRYTNQKRVNGAKIYTRAYILACLADEFYLSIRQIENIVYSSPAAEAAPAAAALPITAAPGAAFPLAA